MKKTFDVKKIKIEKGVPYDNGKEKTGIAKVIGEMEIGDSILVPVASRQSIYNAIKHQRNYLGRKELEFKGRTEKDGMIRFWRMS